MQFQVPQFIERESKVVGPFTLRQFMYLAVPGAFAFIIYFIAPINIFIISAIFAGIIGFILGFMKISGRSVPETVMHAFGFSLSPKTYLWKGKKRQAGADIAQTYQQTPQEQTLSQQIKLKQGGAMKNITQELQTKK